MTSQLPATWASKIAIGLRFALLALVFAGVLIWPTHCNGVEIGDAARGLAYARQNCARCHKVDADGPYSPNPNAPSFEEISKTPGMTGTAIAVWLRTSHPTMPDFIIPAQDTDDLIAYITGLRDKPAQ